jgi:hypothetical protein
MLKFFILIIAVTLFSSEVFYYEFGEKVFLSKLPISKSSTSDIVYYKTRNGSRIGVSNKILVKCKGTSEVCKKLFDMKSILKVEKISNTISLVTIEKDADIFEISNILSQKDEVAFAHPDFIKKKRRR